MSCCLCDDGGRWELFHQGEVFQVKLHKVTLSTVSDTMATMAG